MFTILRPSRDVRFKENPYKQDKPLDKFSYGHAAFGLVAASVFLIIALASMQITSVSVSAYMFNFTLSIIIAAFIFITWELMEHAILKRVYIEEYNMKGWRESNVNSILDIAVAYGAFLIYYIPVMLFVKDTTTFIVFIIIPFAISPILAYLALRKTSK